MLIMIGSKNTKLLEDFEYMQFQKTHKCDTVNINIFNSQNLQIFYVDNTLISDGRIYIPTTGACAFG